MKMIQRTYTYIDMGYRILILTTCTISHIDCNSQQLPKNTNVGWYGVSSQFVTWDSLFFIFLFINFEYSLLYNAPSKECKAKIGMLHVDTVFGSK